MSYRMEDFPPRVRAQVARLLNDAPPLDRPPPPPDKEPAIQSALERWLVARGYGRRTPKRMQRHTTTRWFFHLTHPQDNPVLLDVLLLWRDPDSAPGHVHALELELKAENGRISPDQRTLIATGCGAVAYSLAEAQEIVMAWERTVAKRGER